MQRRMTCAHVHPADSFAEGPFIRPHFTPMHVHGGLDPTRPSNAHHLVGNKSQFLSEEQVARHRARLWAPASGPALRIPYLSYNNEVHSGSRHAF